MTRVRALHAPRTMPVNPLNAASALSALIGPRGGSEPSAEPAAPTLPESGSETAASNLRDVAAALGVDPSELLAQLSGSASGASGSATGEPPAAAAAAAALLRRGEAASAWTSDLTQHRGGLLVDITV